MKRFWQRDVLTWEMVRCASWRLSSNWWSYLYYNARSGWHLSGQYGHHKKISRQEAKKWLILSGYK